MTELYTVTLLGMHNDGSEAFRKEQRFTSKVRAIDCARRMTGEEMTAEHKRRKETAFECNLFVHIIHFIDSEGVLQYAGSGIFSSLLANGARQCFENTKPLFTSL